MEINFFSWKFFCFFLLWIQMSVVNLWTQYVMEKTWYWKEKKNLILGTTCENGLIDKAGRKFVDFNSQSLSKSFCSPRKKDFRLRRRERNKDEVLQGKFVAWPFHSPTKRQLSTLSTSTFHLYILSVHFDLTKKEIFSIWLNFTTLAFVGVHQWANGWWLTNQSERVYCRNL